MYARLSCSALIGPLHRGFDTFRQTILIRGGHGFMPHMMNDAAFRAYAIACSILVIKMFAAGILTSSTRTRVKQFLNPEDAGLLGGAGALQEHPDVQRM